MASQPTEERTLASMFAAQAAATPEATALIFADRAMTYGDLSAEVNRLARYLVANGVGPDVLVPIAFEKCIEMVVAILAVVTAGGAWLPLDTEAPETRIDGILEDSGASLMLTSIELSAGAQTRAGLRVVCLDDGNFLEAVSAFAPDDLSDLDRNAPLRPDNLAYVFYTSGTTGKPKGVANVHQGIVNSLDWMIEEIGVSAHDRGLQRVDYTFDVSIWDTLIPLVTGATLVICEPGAHRDSDYVADVVRTQNISLIYFVPTTLLDFLQNEKSQACKSLRNVIVIGEALTGYLQAKFHETLPDATLWNSYGPTEAAVGVTLWRCRREDGFVAPPIGAPSWHTQLHILDPDLRPVIDGTPGELFIAGLPLARGYHRRPDLTAEKFLPDPFGPPNSRMYRTGDTAERRADGNIYFLGRADSQIKFNGIRIEPGEIEAAIAALPGVARVAVIARKLASGSRLIAYLIGQHGATRLTMTDLRDRLEDVLPRYMIPSFVVYVDDLPQTTSGKLDARALPDPVIEDRPVAYRAPTDSLEALLVSLFSELTGATNIGVDHGFFDLGATSLTAMRLAAKLRAKTGQILPMRALVDHPTAAGLATALRRISPADARPTPIPARGRPAAFLFPGSGGSDLMLGSLCSACSTFVDLQEVTYPDWRSLCTTGATFESLVQNMVNDIIVQVPSGPVQLAGYSFGGNVAYEVARLLRGMGRNVTVLAILDTPAFPRGVAPARPSLLARLKRQWRDHEFGLAVMNLFLSRTPTGLLPALAALARLSPWVDRAAVEHRLSATVMVQLEARAQRPWVNDTRRLDVRTVLFRILDPAEGPQSYDGWGERCADLSTVLVDGDHLSILSPAHLGGFVAKFKSAITGLNGNAG